MQHKNESPVSVLDVAKYVLSKNAMPVTAMKLQKLVYYSQAWTLVWSGKPLFVEETQAWANGPVVWELFNQHRGKYTLTEAQLSAGDASRLTPQQKANVDSVIAAYDSMTATQLSLLTHAEDPWKLARGGMSDRARSNAVITFESMRTYYGTLAASKDAAHSIEEVNFPSWA